MPWGDQDSVLGPTALPDPKTTGYQAAQAAGVNPVAAATPKGRWMAAVAKGQAEAAAAPPPAPSIPANDEPNWGQNDKMAAANYANDRAGGGISTEVMDAQAQDEADKVLRAGAVSKALDGAKFDYKHGLDNFTQRFDLGLSSNSQERMLKLKDKLPPGSDVKVVTPEGQREPMVVYKMPGEDTYHPIRGSEFAPAGDIGGGLSAAPEVAVQAGTAYATGGESLLARLIAQGVAGFGEKIVQKEGERARGYNTDTVAGDVGDASKSGIINSATEGLASLFSKIAMGFKGNARGLFNPPAEGKAASEAADRLGAPALTMGQQGNPLFAAKEQQLAAVSPYVQDKVYTPQAEALAKILSGGVQDLTGGAPVAISAADTPLGKTIYPGLDTVISGMKDEASAGLRNPGVEMTQGGKAVQQGLEDFKNAGVASRDVKYNDAIDSAQGATFNGQPLIDTAKDMEGGVKMHGLPKEVTTEVPANDGGYGLSEPTTKTEMVPTQVTVGETPTPRIGGIIDKIKQLDPAMRQNGDTSAYEGLKAIRTQLGHSIAEYPSGGSGAQIAEYNQAKQLYGALTDVIENPSAASNDYAAKIAAASNRNKFVNGILDRADIAAARKTPTPENIMSLAAPGNFTTLQTLKRTTGENWKTYQDAFLTKLTSKPEDIVKTLDNFRSDPRALDLLVNKPDQAALRNYAEKIQQVQGSLATKMREQTDMSKRVGMLFDGNNGHEIADMITRGGGPDSPIGQNTRAAVMEHILDSGTDPVTGKIDPGRIAKVAGDLIQSGQLKGVLKPAEMQRLTDIRTYAGAIDTGKSTQSSLHVGSVASNAWDIFKPVRMAKEWGNVGLHAFQARIMTSPSAAKFWMGTGQNPSSTIRMSVDAMGGLLDDTRNAEPKMKEPKPEGGN